MKTFTTTSLLWISIIVLVVTQAFGQTDWVKDPNNPIFPRGVSGTWNDQYVLGPSILYDGNNYQVWFSGYGGGSGARTGYAQSIDGINWTEYPDPVVPLGTSGSWDGLTVFQPCVLFNGSTTYKMWFCGHNGILTRQIGYATSPDSINWTKADSINPILTPGPTGSWDELWIDSPEVLYIDGIYHMWYAGSNGTYTQIGHATSLDGLAWEKDTLNPVLEVGDAGSWDSLTVGGPSVLFDGNLYHMWYSGGQEWAYDWKIGYAYSVDGKDWVKYSINNPVLDVGNPGSWDDAHLGAGGVDVMFNQDSSKIKLWYGGGTGFSLGDIGYATSDFLPLSVEDNNSEMPLDFSLLQNYPNPFNPSTKIKYTIAHSSNVVLKVFGVLGNDIETLVNEEKSIGTHIIEFEASNLPSGIYFYQLQTPNFTQTKKMILLK